MSNRDETIFNSNVVITMTVNEVNKVLALMGKYPFEEVFAIVNKIKAEAQPQVDAIVAKVDAAELAAASAAAEKGTDEQA